MNTIINPINSLLETAKLTQDCNKSKESVTDSQKITKNKKNKHGKN